MATGRKERNKDEHVVDDILETQRQSRAWEQMNVGADESADAPNAPGRYFLYR